MSNQLFLIPESELWTLPRLSVEGYRAPTSFPSFHHEKRISLDLETSGLNPLTDYIVGVVIKTPSWAEYFPIRHKGGPNCDATMFIWWLADELEAFSGEMIGANSNLFDGLFLRKEGINPKNLKWRDIQWAEALLNESALSYSLNTLSDKYLLKGKATDFLKDLYGDNVMEHFEEVHPAHARAYALPDAHLAEEVYDCQIPVLESEGLLDLFHLECRLTPLLNSMRYRGVRVDVAKAAEVERYLKGKSQAALENILRVTGMAVNINSPKQVAKVCDSLGVKYDLTPVKMKNGKQSGGNPSFKGPWLKRQTHKFFKLMLEARKYEKACNPFVSKFILQDNINGRVHAQFHPLKRESEDDIVGTASGRFSSTDPNLQQIPARDPELGPLLRSMFLPDEGKDFFAADYSQIEFRLIVNAASLLKCEGADKALEMYRSDPKTDFHDMVATLTGLPRKQAKNINFGMAFCMGAYKLARELGLVDTNGEPTQEAYDILDQYHERVPFVKKVSDKASKRAEKLGYITTLLGRRSRFDLWEPKGGKAGSYKDTALPRAEAEAKYGEIRRAGLHRSLNRYTQGSSADLTKAAMVQAWEAGIITETGPLNLSLTVHDELAGSVERSPAGQEALKELKHIMETSITKGIVVPVVVEAKTGKNWAEAH